MTNAEIIRIQEHPELKDRAAAWFHEKWHIPQEAYLESMEACLQKTAPVPQWYVVMEAGRIVAGLGVIGNDFHNRKDLTPNVCAVYVEASHRNRGIAGQMLQFVCQDMVRLGIRTLYLLTDHTGFYERYGWQFLYMVQGDGEEAQSRMYIHRA